MLFVYCLGIMWPAISDYNNQLILLSMIQLSVVQYTVFGVETFLLLFLSFFRWIIISGWTIRLTLTWNIRDGLQSPASSAGLRSNPGRKFSLFTDTGKVHFRLIFRGILKLWISWRKKKRGKHTNGTKMSHSQDFQNNYVKKIPIGKS